MGVSYCSNFLCHFKVRFNQRKKLPYSCNLKKTGLGYWVCNLNHFSDWNHFETIFAEWLLKSQTQYPRLWWNFYLNQICITFHEFNMSTNWFVSKVLSGGLTCISSNFGHQVALLGSVGIELLSSSARVTSVKSAHSLGWSHWRTSGPIDRTPGTPGSDKNVI